MGPQHPSTHGVLRLVVTLDGEIVHDVIPVIGYLHRCKEKLAEKRTYYQYIPIVDRTEYVAGMNCEWGYVLTVEKLAGIEPTRRAEFIRVIIGELNRIASHQVAVGTFVADLSPLGTAMVFYMFRDREQILDLLEEVSGARMMFNYFRFGGVRFDLPDGWVEKCRDFWPPAQAHRRVRDPGRRQRHLPAALRRQGRDHAAGRGRLRHHRAQRARLGRRPRPAPHAAVLRLSGARLRHLHWASTATCSTATRCASTRCASRARSSCSASTCCPRGRCRSARCGRRTSITPPPGTVYVGQENPRGEYGTYIVSDGSRYPYRLKFRDPCFVNLQIFPKMLRGDKIADAVAISGSIDLVLGGIDRYGLAGIWLLDHRARRRCDRHRLRGGVRGGARQHLVRAPRPGLHAGPPGPQPHRLAGHPAERRRRLQDDGQGRLRAGRGRQGRSSRWRRSWS